MSDHRFQYSLSNEPTDGFEHRLAEDPQHGAVIRFLGVVRDLEDGRLIRGIDYSCYDPMARQMLQQLGESMLSEHPSHRALIHHRLGFVAAGEPSIIIVVQTPHSAAGFELCREYLRRIKQSVPIWKRPVFQDVETGVTLPESDRVDRVSA